MRIVLLPILGTVTEYGLLSRHVVDILCICYLLLFSVLFLRGVRFAMPDIVLAIISFAPASEIPLVTLGTYLQHVDILVINPTH